MITLIALLLAVHAAAQVPVLDSVCSGSTRYYGVYGDAGSTYTWTITPPAGPVIVLPSDADTTEINWTYPAGTYILEATQHALNGCDAPAVYGQIEVFEAPDVYAGPDDHVCVGWYYKLVQSTAAYTSSYHWITSGDGTFDDDTALHPTYTPGPADIAAGLVNLSFIGYGQGYEDACPPDISIMQLFIVTEIVPTFDPIGPLCQYSTPPELPLVSLEGIVGIWDPPVITTTTLGTFTFTFIPTSPYQCGVETTMPIIVTDSITPTFAPIDPVCINSIPPALPDTSLEGITGTWEPPVITTTTPGTFTFTFSPDDPSQCGVPTEIQVSVVTEILPTFDPIGPFCQFSTPPPLPATSNNGISGTWDPPVINTSLPGTSTYNFIPDPDECGLPTSVEITIIEQVIPVFEPIGPLCQYVAAPPLPEYSLNGIHGTWRPAIIITAFTGTFTYTFTPDPETCGAEVTMDITILPDMAPVFTPIDTLCQFSTPPILPTTSLNGVTGTWEPPVISTDITGNFFFTFTPDPTFECALPLTIMVTVIEVVVPEFSPIGPLCQNIIAPALPATSLNGITGTWEPPVINTSVPGTFTFIFTPDEDECAVVTSLDIEIVTELDPQFDPIGPLCQNIEPPLLPGISLNGVTGTWEPPVITTTSVGTFTFTFTPDPSYECALAATLEIEVVSEILPEFDPIGPLCQKSIPPALPSTSNNGITGTWDPATISTAFAGTFTFTFTPADPNQCVTETTMDITVLPEVTPLFTQIGPLCQNTDPPDLPDVSLNGIQGSWVPPNINTTVLGTFTYLFTPDDEEDCAIPVTMDITISTEIIPTFDPVGPLCQYDEAPVLSDTSNNGITGTWSPTVINTSIPGTVTYTFTPDDGQCAVEFLMDITVTARPVVSETIVTDETDGLGNGSIEIIATGVTPQLFYTVTNGAMWQTNNGLFQNLSAGTYYCIVMDENNCDTSFVIEVKNLQATPLEALTGPDSLCLGKKSVVPIRVNKFTNVAEFQLRLSYNEEKLIAENIINVHPDLQDLDADLTGPGEITINWKSSTGVTFNGITTIVDIVFATTESGMGQLEWYATAIDSYFFDPNGNPIMADFYAGQVVIYEPPQILNMADINVCVGQPAIFSEIIAMGTNAPLTYQWIYPNGQSFDEPPQIDSATFQDAGTYTLVVTDAVGCQDVKSLQLIVSNNPVALFHGSDTLTVAPGYILDAGEGLASYLWNTGETGHEIKITLEGWYWVEMLSSADCYGIDSVYMRIPYDCIFIPNAFTPNGDGLNDTFRAYSRCPITYYRMLIYNRWGELLYESHDINDGWDGRKNGKMCQGDAYVYLITYRAEEALGAEQQKTEYGIFISLK